jgi:hypothetical protein
VYVFINKSLFKKKNDFIYFIIVGECVYKEKIEPFKSRNGLGQNVP